MPIDYAMGLVLRDDSLAAMEPGLTVTMFRPRLSGFPEVRAEGDILQLRHIRVQLFNGVLQAISSNWTSFTVFGKEENTWKARPERAILDSEREALERLASEKLPARATVEGQVSPAKRIARLPVEICSVKPGSFVDITVKVLRRVESSHPHRITLITTDLTANQHLDGDPTVFGISERLRHKLLMITFWDEFAHIAEQFEEGQLMRVSNLHIKLIPPGNFLMGVLHGGPRSRVEPVGDPLEDPYAAELEARWQELVANGPIWTDGTVFHLTKILRTDISFCSIADILSFPRDNWKFCVKGVLARYHPNVYDFTRKYCDYCDRMFSCLDALRCGHCGITLGPHSHIYAFCLVISDPSTQDSLPILVCGESGIEFFRGLPPCNMYENTDLAARIIMALDRLAESREPEAFCVQSYRITDEDGIAALRYQLCHTELASI